MANKEWSDNEQFYSKLVKEHENALTISQYETWKRWDRNSLSDPMYLQINSEIFNVKKKVINTPYFRLIEEALKYIKSLGTLNPLTHERLLVIEGSSEFHSGPSLIRSTIVRNNLKNYYKDNPNDVMAQFALAKNYRYFGSNKRRTDIANKILYILSDRELSKGLEDYLDNNIDYVETID